MKISKDLPQFKEEKSLIVVSAGQSAVVYKAHKGFLEELFKTQFFTRPYSDREGFFFRSGRGKRISSGSVYEPKQEVMHREFFKKLSNSLKDIIKKGYYGRVYLFIPHYLTSMMHKYIPYNLKNIPFDVIRGNFVNENPFKLLLKIRNNTDILATA